MGFKLTDRVYRWVKDTTATQQAVLAYLTFRADDRTGGSCYPSYDAIVEATHLSRTAIKDAISDLKKKGLLAWVPGGRIKGGGGRALANEYTFNLPSEQTDAPAAKPKAPRTVQPRATEAPRSESEAEIEERRKRDMQIRQLGATFIAERRLAQMPGKSDSPILEALRVCGVNDFDNRKAFTHVLLRKNHMQSLFVIRCFEQEIKEGKHVNANCLAAILNARLKKLPDYE